MWRSVVLAGLMLVLGGAPPATILDQVEIEAKATQFYKAVARC
jgi:hypothetical protein